MRPSAFGSLVGADGDVVIGADDEGDLGVRLDHVHHGLVAGLDVPFGGQRGNDFHLGVVREGIEESADALGGVVAWQAFEHAYLGFPVHHLGGILAQRSRAFALRVADDGVDRGWEGSDVGVDDHDSDAGVDCFLNQGSSGVLVMGGEDDRVDALGGDVLEHLHLGGDVRAALGGEHEGLDAQLLGQVFDARADRHVVVELGGGRHVGDLDRVAGFVGYRRSRLRAFSQRDQLRQRLPAGRTLQGAAGASAASGASQGYSLEGCGNSSSGLHRKLLTLLMSVVMVGVATQPPGNLPFSTSSGDLEGDLAHDERGGVLGAGPAPG